MRVILIGPFPPPLHGNSLANLVLHKNLTQRKISATIIDTSGDEISSKQGNSFSSIKAIKFIKKYFQLYKIFFTDYIYITPGHTFFGLIKYAPFIFASIIIKKPYILHLHGNNLRYEYENAGFFKAALMKFLISKASAGIILSNTLKHNLDCFLPDSKIHVVFNFVQNEFYTDSMISKPTDKLRILYLSNIMREKGILDLLDSLIILKDKNIEFEFLVAGSVENSITDVFFEKFTQLGNNAKYLGVITGEIKLSVLSNSNVLILPTYYQMEAQPISLLEGMATGNIILTTSHSGIPDVFSKRNGFYIEKKSPLSITVTLEDISKNLVSYVTNYSYYNRSYSQNCFTEEIFTNNVLKVIKSLF